MLTKSAPYVSDQLEQRRHRRVRRTKEERRREKRIELETNRIIGLPRPPKPIQLESNVQFPRFEDAMARIEAENAARERTESESTHLSEGSLGESSGGASSLEKASTIAGPSFATMLANAKDPPASSGATRPQWPLMKKKARTTADVGRYICAAGSKLINEKILKHDEHKWLKALEDNSDHHRKLWKIQKPLKKKMDWNQTFKIQEALRTISKDLQEQL
nr:unnamed protein product [Callosobruchus chinensis]